MARLSEGHGPTSWVEILGPAIVAGLLGAALNSVVQIDLYTSMHIVFGSVPVLAVALLFGMRAGIVAGAIAGLPTVLMWGHWYGWLIYGLEAAFVGGLARRVHPAITVVGFWLLIGEPFFWLVGHGLAPGFVPLSTTVAIKAPIQELFCALLAQTLLYIAPLRDAIRRVRPDARLPLVPLVNFQLTFLALAMVSIAGSMLLVEAVGLYRHERATLAQYNQAAAQSVSVRLETLLQGYDTAVMAVAAPRWADMSPTERQVTASHLLTPEAFWAIAWLDHDFRVRSGWHIDDGGRMQAYPPGTSFGRGRSLGDSLGAMPVVREVRPRGKNLREPFLVLLTPSDDGYVVGVVPTRVIEGKLQAATPLTNTEVTVVDGQGRPILSALPGPTPPAPVEAGGTQHGLRSESPVAGSDWRVWVITPEWAVRAQVNQAMRSVLPTLLPVLLLVALLGLALLAVMDQEFRQLGVAVHRVGRVEHAVPGLPDTFLHEFQGVYETLAKVSMSLRQTLQALRTRDAELTISNSQLGATVDELRAVEHSRGEVLNAISHDIKIPLTAIMGYTELLEDEAAGPLNGSQKEYVTGIGENSQRVIRLLEDLLDLTRLEVGRFPIEPQAIAPAEALTRTQRNLQPLIDRKGLSMKTDAAPDLPPVNADPGRLDQVLNNLVSNAIKFTPEGGHIVLRAYPSPEGGLAVVQVIDDGPGIAAEHLPHLFERFYRVPGTRAGGTGLGLAISKGLVEAMGGTMGVISEPGKGSTFWFTLPFVEREAEMPGAGVPSEGHAG